MAVSILLLAVLAFFFFALSPSTANENNLILTGGVLGPDEQLSYGSTVFVMQGDCNLVLYDPHGFQSNTHGRGTNCTLTLNQLGQLVIRNSDGYPLWASPIAPNSKNGNYVAVLRPDGQVGIYGASVWSSSSYFNTANSANESYSGVGESKQFPIVRNILFSNQIIYESAELKTRDYALVMKQDCSLALVRGAVRDIWVSGTQGKGQNCFASLSRHGKLVVYDFNYIPLWSSSSSNIGNDEEAGEYVLVLQINGEAVIYGPMIWSTDSHY